MKYYQQFLMFVLILLTVLLANNVSPELFGGHIMPSWISAIVSVVLFFILRREEAQDTRYKNSVLWNAIVATYSTILMAGFTFFSSIDAIGFLFTLPIFMILFLMSLWKLIVQYKKLIQQADMVKK